MSVVWIDLDFEISRADHITSGVQIHIHIFPTILKGDNFCDFLFAFWENLAIQKRCQTPEGKNFAPRGAKSVQSYWFLFIWV